MFCGTSVVNSCARCIRHSVCPEGMVVKLQGEYPHLPGPRSVLMPHPPTPTSHLLLPEGQKTSPIIMMPRMHPEAHVVLSLHLRCQAQKEFQALPWLEEVLGWLEARGRNSLMLDKQERNLKFLSWRFPEDQSWFPRFGPWMCHASSSTRPSHMRRVGHPSFPVHPVNSTLPSGVRPDITS